MSHGYEMKIANWYGGKQFRIENVPKPKIRKSEALIKVKAVSVCGSEIHAYTGVSKRREEIHGLPLVMGHEFSGVVSEIGDEVTNIAVGDRVAVNPIVTCGTCEQCMTGRSNICSNFQLLGLHVDGAFAEYVPIVGKNCIKLPDSISFEEASLLEPCSNAIHAVNITSFELGDDVAILGEGPIGLLALQTVRFAGAGRVFVTGHHDYRLEMAKRLGANDVINANYEDPAKKIMELTDGKGVDVVLETAGTTETLRQGLELIKKGKTITLIGMKEKVTQIKMIDVPAKEARIQGHYGYTAKEFGSSIKLVAAHGLNLKALITHEFSLEDIAKGFELLAQKEDKVIKVVLKP